MFEVRGLSFVTDFRNVLKRIISLITFVFDLQSIVFVHSIADSGAMMSVGINVDAFAVLFVCDIFS